MKMLQAQSCVELASSCLIAIGANIPSSEGSVRETLEIALKLLNDETLCCSAVSQRYQTPAYPPGNGPDYVNAAVLAKTSLSPQKLIARLHAVEHEMGRKRHVRWESRVLDLDLLAYEDLVLPDPKTFKKWSGLSSERQMQEAPEMLILPHPRMQDRGFVLVPLNDVAPDWRHPVLGKTVRQMLEELSPADIEGIVALPSYGEEL